MSPTLLSQRLKELEAAGVVTRVPIPDEPDINEYHLTAAGKDLLPVVRALGIWGQRWVESNLSLRNLDASLLMWDMRRNLDPTPLPKHRVVVKFCYPELSPARGNFWLVVDPEGSIDLCATDPGFEIDLYVTTDLRTMTAIWMGLDTIESSLERIDFHGSRKLAASMQQWLGLSPFAGERNLAEHVD